MTATLTYHIEIFAPEIEKQLKRIADAVEKIAGGTPVPPGTEITKPQIAWGATSQIKENDMLKMVGKFTFTSVNPNEGVASRKFSIAIDGASPIETTYDADTLESDEVKLPVGSHVVAQLIDIDESGNESQPAIADFTVTDSIAPTAPGEFGFAASGQVDE